MKTEINENSKITEDISVPGNATEFTTGVSVHLNILTLVIKTGFKLLSILFVVLGVIFLFSNTYWVPEGTVAVHSRLGAIADADNIVKRPGGPYFALPFPIDNIIKLPTTIQQMTIDKAFMLEEIPPEAQKKRLMKVDAFKPGVHGSLITGDKNIVQGIWTIHFRLDISRTEKHTDTAILQFLKNTGTMKGAEAVIRVLSENAIIRTVSGTTVGDFVSGRIDHESVKTRIQRTADSLRLGVSIVSVTALHYSPPEMLESDFQAVTQAESDKTLHIEKAMRYRSTTLNEITGEQWGRLLDAIVLHELAVMTSDKEQEHTAFTVVENLLLSGQLGGTVASQLDKARTEKTAIVEKSRASVSRFSELLDAYRKDPFIVKNQLFQDAFKDVLTGPFVKVHWVSSGQKIYLGNPDNSGED